MANGTLKVENIQTSSGSGTITLGQSGETIALGSNVTSKFNQPAFEAALTSNLTGQAAGTNILLSIDNEKYDSGGCYNNTGSSTTLNGLTAPQYSFTPNFPGKYFVYGFCRLDASTTFPNDAYLKIYKNGSVAEQQQRQASGNANGVSIQRTIELNGTGDYIQLYVIAYNSSGLILTGGNQMAFGAYRIG